MWLAWVFGCVISGTASALVIFHICSHKKLRRTQFNRFVVALAIPDSIFSLLCAISCLGNYINGSWAGGNINCEIQSVYCTFGMAASIFVNVAVVRELHRMGKCSINMKRYKPLTWPQFRNLVGGIYAFALSLSLMTLVPGLPFKANAMRGLACLPTEYDMASSVSRALSLVHVSASP